MRVLVAETDLLFLAEMRQALEEAGHEVIGSSDGLEAWDYLTGTTPPDLLVTRTHLELGKPPGTALGLHANACQPPIPVIYIPESADAAQHADPEHGAVLVKPFPVTHLVETINRLAGSV